MKHWYLRTQPAQEALACANKHLESARKTQDKDLARKSCKDAKRALGRIKVSASIMDLDQIIASYREHGRVLKGLGQDNEALISYNKADELRERYAQVAPAPPTTSSAVQSTGLYPPSITIPIPTLELIPNSIFARDSDPHALDSRLPKPDARLDDTRQLVYCLGLLQNSAELDDILDTETRTWLLATREDGCEQERLQAIAKDILREFTREKLKDASAIAEVVCLAPVLEKQDFRFLLEQFVNGLSSSVLLNTRALEGLKQLVQSAPQCSIDADDLVKILKHLNLRLEDTLSYSPDYIYRLTEVVSHILDAMALGDVRGLSRANLHTPLTVYLQKLIKSADPYLAFQAAYASQALLWVPNDEELWKAALRHTGTVVLGVAKLVSAAKALNVLEFIEGLNNIQSGVEGAGQFLKPVANAYKAATELIKGGRSLLELFTEDFSFSCKQKWYPLLRAADTLLRDGELTKFKSLIFNAPCRRDIAFQWGVCQRLGGVAADPQRDSETRHGAIEFLGEIYRNDAAWGHKTHAKKCILNILMQLAFASDFPMLAAKVLLHDLRNDGDATKQAHYQACLKDGPNLHPWKVALPPLKSSPLLDRVQNKPSIEIALRKFQHRRLREYDHRNTVYIPPQAKVNREAPDDELFDLTTKVNEFLASDQKVLLLLGDSGAGKSTFNLELEHGLWDTYSKYKKRIPVFVTLPAIEKPEQDLIAKHLRRYGFDKVQIQELKSYYEFVLICDGYDECQQKGNLYVSNQLNQPEEWNVQMVITCRSEYLGQDYHRGFQPGDRNDWTGRALLQEAVIAPFSDKQIRHYIEQYVAKNAPHWEVEDYLQVLDQVPGLQDLVKNPFLLTLSLGVLPDMVDPGKNLSSTKVTRVALYDKFVEQWVDRGLARLYGKILSENDAWAFEKLRTVGFSQKAVRYLKDLAVAIFEHQNGAAVVEYSPFDGEDSWQHAFFSKTNGKNLLCEACPIFRIGSSNQYRFIHRSVLEYGLARAVFEPLPGEKHEHRSVDLTTSAIRQRSMGGTSTINNAGGEQELSAVKGLVPNSTSPLFRRSFVREPSILHFLAERVQQEPMFKQELLAFIEQSKVDDTWSIAAANAITILVRARILFNGADLKGIRIPGADLSGGQFDSAQLQEAVLSNVILHNIWLRQANLSNARMDGVDFGERPYLTDDISMRCRAYSPDGKSCVFGLADGTISVYNTMTWVKIRSLQGHLNSVNCVIYSPNGQQIASGSDDRTVRLWDVETGTPGPILRGHTLGIVSVVYSPSGHQIASGGYDKTVRLWDMKTGAPGPTLGGHTGSVYSVVYSPSGQQIASSSGDGTVRLCDSQNGAPGPILSGHTGEVLSVRYSPSGQQIASGSTDKTVRLWNSQTGAPGPILGYHTDTVRAVVYSPSGQQIASGSDDKTVRLWDAQTGAPGPVFSGHIGWISSVVYSPSGQRIASGSSDKTVRLWDALSGIPGPILSGHTGEVLSVVYSPNGQQIASGSSDNTVRLWDAQTGVPGPILSGHSGQVLSVVYSPSGQQIASGSGDGTVRLWDAQTGAPGFILGNTTQAYNVYIQTCSVVYSPNGRQIASCSYDGMVRLWDAQTGASDFILSGHFLGIRSIVYSPSGEQIASGGWDSTMRLWDVQTGAPGPMLSGHTDWVTSLVYSPSGRQIASGSDDKTVRLWDTQSGTPGPILRGHTDAIQSVVYSPSGHQIASGSSDRTVRLWDAQTGAAGPILDGHTSWDPRVVYSPNGQQIASGSNDGTVRLWDAQTGAPCLPLGGYTRNFASATYLPNNHQVGLGSHEKSARLWHDQNGVSGRFLNGHTNEVKSLMYSSNGLQVASGSLDKTVRLWDTLSCAPGAILSGHTRGIKSVVYSPNGQQIASGSLDRTVRLWDAQTGASGLILRGHTNQVSSVVYSPDGRRIASSSFDGTVRLWDAQTGAPGPILSRHTSRVRVIVYSPGGQQIASGSDDKTVRLWDAQTGAPGPILGRHTGEILCIVYSPSGQQIASGSSDNTVRLWDTQTGAPGPILSGHTSWVPSVVYSPGGQQIASGSGDKTVRLWDAQTGALGSILSGHASQVSSMAYSVSGQQIASYSDDSTVRLWDVNLFQCLVVVNNFHGLITSIAWNITPNGICFSTGCSDNSVRMWQFIEEEDHHYVRLQWSTMHEKLIVSNVSLQGVQGLSEVNIQLLDQRTLHGMSKKPLGVASTAAKLKMRHSYSLRFRI